MKKLIVCALVVVILGIVLQIGAVPTVPPIPPIPSHTPEPTSGPTPGPGPSPPIMEKQQRFEVFSVQPVLEGYAGGSIDYDLKVLQKGYPELVVHLTAEVPEKWKATFSQNDFNLKSDDTVVLQFSLSVPVTISVEKQEIKIRAVGKAKEGTTEVKASTTLTAMTYFVDVGVSSLQLSPLQPRTGESVTITVIAVNYTQRTISNVIVELLVNNNLSSRQTVQLSAGTSQPITFGWTAQPGTSTLLVRSQVAGDTNRKNDSVMQSVNLEDRTGQIDILYQQAIVLYTQGTYDQAQNLFAMAAAQYTEAGDLVKAAEATRLQGLCDSYMQAQKLMSDGEQAYQAGDYEKAAQSFEEAMDVYMNVGDTEKQGQAQQRMNEALAAQTTIDPLYIVISAVAIVIVVAAVFFSRRRRYPAYRERERERERPSRFRLEEEQPVSRPVSMPPAREPFSTGAAPPAELIQFHQKTEDALSRFTKGYIRDNLQQAMRIYLSLEGERKQLPRGRDLELERIVDTNLRELEHRIFGTF